MEMSLFLGCFGGSDGGAWGCGAAYLDVDKIGLSGTLGLAMNLELKQ